MTAPVWQPGHLYIPGDIVQPASGTPTAGAAIVNPALTGSATGWDLTAPWVYDAGTSFAPGSGSLKFDAGVTGFASVVATTGVAVNPGTTITAQCQCQQGASSAGNLALNVNLFWYDAADVFISAGPSPTIVNSGSGGEWLVSTSTDTAPANAAFVRIGASGNRVGQNLPAWVDNFTWDYANAPAPAGLVFQAVQPNPGMSAGSEPVWPSVLGVQVVDNEVTWEAIAATRVVWEASPILASAGTEPTWPTTVGGTVADGSIVWEAYSRRVEDENCPNTKVVAIVGSKVHAADRDVGRYCATANPLDWTTERDAGYLPLGLQQANANDFNSGVFNQYRGNLVCFNASSFQNWQADPDPAAMALLDQMDGIGSTWQQAAQPVANDLFYLAALGVRTVGIAGGSTNLQAGDVGMPIDPLVRDAVKTAVMAGTAVRSTYYPSAGQYWLAFADYPPPLPSIVGDVPDGFVSASVSGSYVVSGGVPPYGPITALSGTFPPGLTLNPDGSYSGAFTTVGDYTWTVGGVDAMGVPFSTPDTAEVIALPWFSSSTTGVVKSIDGVDWLAAPAVDSGISIFSGAGKVVNVRFAAGLSVGDTTSDLGTTWAPHTGLSAQSCNQGTYTGTHFLICANDRTVNRSTDAVAWTPFQIGTGVLNTNLLAIDANGATVLVGGTEEGNGHNIAVSTDHGATFPVGVMCFGAGITRDVYAIAHSGSRFIAVGNQSRMAYTDTNGGSWTQIVSPFPGADTVRSIASNGAGVWVAVNIAGQIGYSANNGVTWSLSADTVTADPACTVGYGAGRFIIGSANQMKASADGGATWTLLPDNQTGLITGITPLQ